MIELNPSSNVVTLLLFLESAGIEFKITDPKGLAASLVPEINNPRLTPSLLANLRILDILDYMPESFDDFKEVAKKMQTLPSGRAYRAPSAAFKAFCGSESLNSCGKISRDSAIDAVNRHIKINGLNDLTDKYLIHLDCALQEALATKSSITTVSSLTNLVETIFSD